MPIGVLLVTGGMTHQEGYAAGFRADPRAKIAAVSDERDVDERRARLNRKLASDLGVPYVPDLDDALGRADVQAVSITTEHHRQGRVTVRCAEAGKHLYMDKPLSGSLEEARRVEAIAKQKGLRTQMFTQVLFPPAQRARRAAMSGRIGDLRAIFTDLHFSKGYAGDFAIAPRKEHDSPEMFLYPDAKREVFNIAVYSLAMIRWLAGRKAFRSVRAVTGNYFFEENKRRGFEDFGVLAVALDGGITATVSAGRTGWRSHPAGGHHRIRLVGTRGSHFVDGSAVRGEVQGDRQQFWKTPPPNPEDPMGFWASSDQRKSGATEWFAPGIAVNLDQSAFLDCVEQGRDAEVTVSDGVRVLELLLAAYRSASTGDLVSLR